MSLVENPKFIQLKVSGRLPTPKGIALEIIKLTQQEDVSNQAIAHLIGADAALSARVIKAANILLSNSTRPVVTISDAVLVLGIRGLRQLVLSIALIVDYRHGPCKQFDYIHYWTHSLLTGITAKHLAQHARLAAAEEIFVVGLFSRIGHLALASVYTDDYGAILSSAKTHSVAQLQQLQFEKFGFDESELSEAILADMHFPAIFQTLVRHCSQPEKSNAVEASREWRLLHLLHLSMALGELFLAKPATRSKLLIELRRLSTQLGIEWEDVTTIGDTCVQDWLEWSSLLNMGGKLDVASFSELVESVEISDESALSPPLKHESYALRVLVVDDDNTVLTLLDAILRAAGHQVQLAHHGVEALEMIRQRPPQLLISDWMMPEMDGISLCRKLRENADFRNMYVIIMTAQESPDKLVEAFEAGADDYLVKPVIGKIFMARLRAAQRTIQMQEELASDREQLQRLSNDLTAANQHLLQLALTDSLTGLPNRRAAMERLDQEWSLTQRSNHPFACMVVDIDHFKQVNDQFGHPVGDQVLKSISNSLRQAARMQDLVCRFGGEEFLVICPDTDIEAAVQCAERLRMNVAATDFTDIHPTLKLTISIGVGAVKNCTGTLNELLIRVDKCLYAAKQAGRNKTVADK
jgi:diguanylate cyclase (GGDEF)-like protein